MNQEALAQPALACSQCGRMFGQSDLVQIAGTWVCGDCKPAFLSRVMAGDRPATAWHYGGFWIRFVAQFLDGFLQEIVRIPIALLLLGAAVLPFRTYSGTAGNPTAFTAALFTVYFITFMIACLYEVIMIRQFGATLGKMAVGVKVVRTDGSGISWGISIGRYFMKLVSGFILAIGYIMAGFDSEKRALHDRVCDTRVVYKRSLA
jgi:uncharacterized RDD family membrane protein YckC